MLPVSHRRFRPCTFFTFFAKVSISFRAECCAAGRQDASASKVQNEGFRSGLPRQCVPQRHLLRGAHWLGMTDFLTVPDFSPDGASRDSERFFVRTRRGGTCVMRGFFSRRGAAGQREVFRQDETRRRWRTVCTSSRRPCNTWIFSPDEAQRDSERFFVRTRRGGAGVPCVRQADATKYWRKRSAVTGPTCSRSPKL